MVQTQIDKNALRDIYVSCDVQTKELLEGIFGAETFVQEINDILDAFKFMGVNYDEFMATSAKFGLMPDESAYRILRHVGVPALNGGVSLKYDGTTRVWVPFWDIVDDRIVFYDSHCYVSCCTSARLGYKDRATSDKGARIYKTLYEQLLTS